MDHMLDSKSDRRVEPPARVSLGLLGPGAYAIELQGIGWPRIAHVRIVDRDVHAVFQ